MGNRLFPITFDLMYRSILGRTAPTSDVDEIYRGHRVMIIEGDIVGVPHYAPDPELFRTLMAASLGFADDGDPAIRIHFCSLPPSKAFDPERGNLSMKDYFNSTFVIVRPTSGSEDADADDDSNDVICVNFFALGTYESENCPTFVNNTEQEELDGSAVFTTTGGGEIESVMNGDYTLTETTHYTYEDGVLTITAGYLDYETNPTTLTVTFVGCNPYDITINDRE